MTTRLREALEQIAEAPTKPRGDCSGIRRLRNIARAALATYPRAVPQGPAADLATIREWHMLVSGAKTGAIDRCAECGPEQPWPCDTVVLLDRLAEMEGARNPAKAPALAVYGGINGGEEPDTDEGALLAIADWLDRIDDATDEEFRIAGKDHRVGRTIQASLRRIAARLLTEATDV